MKKIIALALLLSPAAIQAQSVDAEGLWRGTIGNLPVHACFGRANAYYYDEHLQPIRLAMAERAGNFAEELSYDKPSDARWQIDQVTGDTLSGSWSNGKRTLPIALSRMDFGEGENRTPACGSPEFMAPRLVGGTVDGADDTFNGTAVQMLRYIPTAAFGGPNAVVVESFSIAENQPGDAAINQELALYLPKGGPDDEFAQCLSGNLQTMGVDGDFQQVVAPEIITQRWLGLIDSGSAYCGGAHPNSWQQRRIFDRQSGEEVRAADWLNDRGMTRETFTSGEDAYTSETLTPQLRDLIVSRWPAEPAAEDGEETCADAASMQDYWNIGLAAGGLAFIPSFPHVMTACAETIVVPWNDLNPFLTETGQEAAVSLEGNP